MWTSPHRFSSVFLIPLPPAFHENPQALLLSGNPKGGERLIYRTPSSALSNGLSYKAVGQPRSLSTQWWQVTNWSVNKTFQWNLIYWLSTKRLSRKQVSTVVPFGWGKTSWSPNTPFRYWWRWVKLCMLRKSASVKPRFDRIPLDWLPQVGQVGWRRWKFFSIPAFWYPKCIRRPWIRRSPIWGPSESVVNCAPGRPYLDDSEASEIKFCIIKKPNKCYLILFKWNNPCMCGSQ